MNRVHFVVVDPETGAVLRHGYCVADDAHLQGAMVCVFETDPGITGLTHRYDPAAQTFRLLNQE